MAKSIITQDNDVVNYNNLIAVSVEPCSIEYAEDKFVEESGIIATDVKGGEILLFHSPNDDDVSAAMGSFIQWLRNETFGTFEMPESIESGDS